MRRILLAGVLAALVLVPTTSRAHQQAKSDPNDTPGRLDMAGVVLDHGQKVILRITFQQAVKKSDFAGYDHAWWIVDTPGGGRSIDIRTRKHNGQRTVFCIVRKLRTGQKIGKVPANLNGANVTCKLPERLMPEVPVAARAISLYNGHDDITDILEHD